MSSKASKISKEVETRNREQRIYWESNFFGTAVITIGKLAGIAEDKLLCKADELSKKWEESGEEFNLETLTEKIADWMGLTDLLNKYRDFFVAIMDNNNVFGPVITITDEYSNVYPISSEYTPRILFELYNGNEAIEVIKLFGDDDD